MQDTNAHHGISPGHAVIKPRIVILQVRKIPVPRGLPADGGRIVPLRLAVHGSPAQMRHPGGDAKGSLPVPGQLIPLKVKVPLGHAVHFAQNAGLSVLSGNACRLLGGGKVPVVAQIVDAGQLEFPVAAHGVPHDGSLSPHTVLPQQMAGGKQTVPFTPCPDLAAVGPGKHFRKGMIIVVACPASFLRRPVPHKIRQALKEIPSVHGAEHLRKFFREGQAHVLHVLRLFRKAQAVDMRFIRENRGYCHPEIIPHGLIVPFMGQGDELCDSFFFQCIHIGLVVAPGRFTGKFDIQVPFDAFGFLFPADDPGPPENAVFHLHVVGMKKAARRFFIAALFFHEHGKGILEVFIPGRRQPEPPCPVCDLFRHFPAGNARGIAVLVIQPAEHAVFPGLIPAEADQIHERIVQVPVLKAHPYVNMESAHSHPFEFQDLLFNHLPGHTGVPGPEGRPAVAGARMKKCFL